MKKKWKDKLFAAAINWQDIQAGAVELGIDTWEHVGIVLDAMKGIAAEKGLMGGWRWRDAGTWGHGDAGTWDAATRGLDGAKLLTLPGQAALCRGSGAG